MQVGLVYPERARWPKLAWVSEALTRLGHTVFHVESRADLQAADEACDLILFEHKNAGLNTADLLEVAAHKRARWLQWWFDLIAADINKTLAAQTYCSPDTFLPVMQAMDAVLVKERGLLDEYRALGIHARFCDQACPAWIEPCEHREAPEFDVLILGGFGYKQRRRDVQALISAGFRVAWAGHPAGDGPPRGVTALPFCPVKELPQLVSRAAVCLDVCLRHDLDGYVSDRLYLLCGTGACVLRRETPGQPDIDYHSYRDHGELLAWVSQLTKHVADRRHLGSLARAEVLAKHTYEHRVTEIFANGV